MASASVVMWKEKVATRGVARWREGRAERVTKREEVKADHSGHHVILAISPSPDRWLYACVLIYSC
jgi:hypothetical protein